MALAVWCKATEEGFQQWEDVICFPYNRRVVGAKAETAPEGEVQRWHYGKQMHADVRDNGWSHVFPESPLSCGAHASRTNSDYEMKFQVRERARKRVS